MPTLTSITVSPTNPFIITLAPYNTQAFTAIASFSDAPPLDITTNPSTLWASSQTSIATIATVGISKGTATAASLSGSTVISATYNGLTGTTILRVGLANYSRIFEKVVEGVKRTETSLNAPHNPISKLTTANFSMVAGGVVLLNANGTSGGVPIGWTIASGHPGDFTKTYIANEQQQDGYWVQLNGSGLATTTLNGTQRSLGVVKSISVDSSGNQLSGGGNPVLVQIAGEAYVWTSDSTITLGSFLVPDTAGKVKATTFDPMAPTPIIGYSLEDFSTSTYPGMVLMRIQLCGE